MAAAAHCRSPDASAASRRPSASNQAMAAETDAGAGVRVVDGGIGAVQLAQAADERAPVVHVAHPGRARHRVAPQKNRGARQAATSSGQRQQSLAYPSRDLREDRLLVGAQPEQARPSPRSVLSFAVHATQAFLMQPRARVPDSNVSAAEASTSTLRLNAAQHGQAPQAKALDHLGLALRSGAARG